MNREKFKSKTQIEELFTERIRSKKLIKGSLIRMSGLIASKGKIRKVEILPSKEAEIPIMLL